MERVVVGFCSFPSAPRVFASEGNENRDAMSSTPDEGSRPKGEMGRGELGASLSRA
ncbi:MAG: hypothetical protein QOE28_37, partial [Solirubrobacteraceae bacterium]|nr:hypothetical protein [Solirubrobacteraceae bacterium]